MANITKRLVESLRATTADVFAWDDALPGFGIRVKPSGAKSYVIQYRTRGGRSRRFTIGRHGILTAEEARREARQLLAAVERGEDPAGSAKAFRASLTVTEVCDRFLTEHAAVRKKASSYRSDKWLVEKFIKPRLGSRKAAEITRADVLSFHNGLRATPGNANRARMLLSKIMNCCEVWGLRPDGSNPCRHVKPYREQRRERFLSPAELGKLGEALGAIEQRATELPCVIPAIRLLLFTGCRLGEILGLKWEWVDFDDACLRLPDSKTGAKVVHLNAPALSVLSGLERVEKNPFVIRGARVGSPLVNLRKPWCRVLKRAGIVNLRLHDLRHSFASVGVALGQGLPIVGKLLGHSTPQTTSRYAHLANDPVRAANEKIGEALSAMMRGTVGQVIPLTANNAA